MVKIEGANFPTGHGPSGRDYVTYDMFVNWNWDQLFKYATRPQEKNTDTTKPTEAARPYG